MKSSETNPWHAAQEPTTDVEGDERHPAFGYIRASRTTGGSPVLFDSDIIHQHTVRVRVGRMSRKRDLQSDWLHPEEELVEVEMSEAQWASFVSSMNTTGVPCTLRRTETEVNVPGIPHAPRLKHSMDETHAAAEEAFAEIRSAMAAYDALDPKVGVVVRRQALSKLRSVIQNAAPNVDFAGKMLAEHVENVVQKARADVEAMVIQKERQLGIDASGVSAALEAS